MDGCRVEWKGVEWCGRGWSGVNGCIMKGVERSGVGGMWKSGEGQRQTVEGYREVSWRKVKVEGCKKKGGKGERREWNCVERDGRVERESGWV